MSSLAARSAQTLMPCCIVPPAPLLPPARLCFTCSAPSATLCSPYSGGCPGTLVPGAATAHVPAARVAAAKSAHIRQEHVESGLDFPGPKVIYRHSDWPLAKLQEYFKNDTLSLIGYGSQGHGQGLNACDSSLNAIIGVGKDGESWRQAIENGWIPGETLFPIEETINEGTIISCSVLLRTLYKL